MSDEDLLWVCEVSIAWLEYVKHQGHGPNCKRYSALDPKIGCQCVIAQADADMERIMGIERMIQAWRRQKYEFFASMKKTWKPSTSTPENGNDDT